MLLCWAYHSQSIGIETRARLGLSYKPPFSLLQDCQTLEDDMFCPVKKVVWGHQRKQQITVNCSGMTCLCCDFSWQSLSMSVTGRDGSDTLSGFQKMPFLHLSKQTVHWCFSWATTTTSSTLCTLEEQTLLSQRNLLLKVLLWIAYLRTKLLFHHRKRLKTSTTNSKKTWHRLSL